MKPNDCAAVAGALLVVAGVRLLSSPEIVGDPLAWPGNDPYHYRTVIADALEAGNTAAAIGAETGDAGTYAAGAVVTAVGGDTALALLPVMAAVLTAGLVGLATRRLTDRDRRATVTAILVVGVWPIHAHYSSVGFVDHHALDQLALAACLAATVRLCRAPQPGERGAVDELLPTPERTAAAWALAGSLAVAMLLWANAPAITLLPLAVAAVALAALASQHGRDAPRLPALAAACLAATPLAAVPWLVWGWQSAAVVLAPAATGLGIGAVALVARRRHRGWRAGRPIVAGVGVGLAGVAAVVGPRLGDGLGALLGRDGAGEAAGLLASGAVLEGWPLWYSGGLLVWLVPALLYLTARAWARDRPAWLATCAAAWSLLALALVQLRFLSALAVVVAPVVAVGLLDGLARLGCGPAPLVGRRVDIDELDGDGVVVLALVLGVAAGAAVAVAAAPAPTADQTAAMGWLDEHADGPVLAPYEDARGYNWAATGEGRSYRLSERHWAAVVRGERSPADGVEFVVVERQRAPSIEWGGGPTRVWQRGDISIYEVTP